MDLLHLEIVTPEKTAFVGEAEAISAPASEGEVTILPNHIPLFSKLSAGEIRVHQKGRWQNLAVAGGFMDVTPDGKVTVLADSAVRVEELSLIKAEEAKKRAEERMQQKLSDREFALVTSDLRRAVLELKLARKYRRGSASLPGE